MEAGLPSTLPNPDNQQVSNAVRSREHICLSIFGRCGAMFLHSLFDGHPQLTTIPGIAPYRLLAAYAKAKNDKISINLSQFPSQAAQIFCHAFNDPYLRADAGLDRLGPEGDVAAEVNPAVFAEHLHSAFAASGELSMQSVSEAMHNAFDATLNLQAKRKIFLQLHTLQPGESEAIVDGVKHRHLIFLVREPLDNIESCAVYLLGNSKGRRDRLSKFYSIIDGMMKFQAGQRFLRDNAVAVRMEDLKRHKDLFLKKLCEAIDLEFDASLMSSTAIGMQYHSVPTRRNPGISGFAKPSSEPQGYRLTAKDRQILAALFDPMSHFMDYDRSADMTLVEAVGYLERNVLDVEVEFAKIIGISPQDFGRQADVRGFRVGLQQMASRRTDGLSCRRLLFPG